MYNANRHHFISVDVLTKIIQSIPKAHSTDKYPITLYPDEKKILHIQQLEKPLHYNVVAVFRYSQRNSSWFLEEEGWATIRIIL